MKQIKPSTIETSSQHVSLNLKEMTEMLGSSSLVIQFFQLFDLGKALGAIKESEEYVVQIPKQFMSKLKSGELFINKNLKTGVEWPSLVKKSKAGRWEFVCNLPMKRESINIDGIYQGISQGLYNIYNQQQLAEIKETLGEIKEFASRIEKRQVNNMFSKILTGVEQVYNASITDNAEDRKAYIHLGQNNLLTGINELQEELKLRAENFKTIPENDFLIFLLSFTHKRNYLCSLDDEYNEIEECYEMYNKAICIYALSWFLLDKHDEMRNTFSRGIAFIESLNIDNIKTIENIHKGADLSQLFYKTASNKFKTEQEKYLEESITNNIISIELTGKEFKEVFENGKVA